MEGVKTFSMDREHLLSLKVMRLTRPTFFPPLVVNCEPRDLPGDLFAQEAAADCSLSTAPAGLHMGQLLLLPQSFGDIYLGETFSCYISIHNDGKDVATDVNIKVDLQTSSLRQALYGAGSNPGESLVAPGDNKDIVINHEIKEGGVHMLVCAVNYSAADGEKLHFRKLFKFQVNRPLDVKTKFYNAESDKVFLEAQVQNLTAGPICLERVSLDPSPVFQVEQLNTVGDELGSDGEGDVGKSVFGDVNYVAAQDVRQYLYCLSPKQPLYKAGTKPDNTTSIGRLDIVWRSSMGETGRLQTSTLQKMSGVAGDVRLCVEEIPNIVQLEEPFHVTLSVTNLSERTIDLKLELENKQSGLEWVGGVGGKGVGKVESGGSVNISLQLLPLSTGLHTLSGLTLVDMFLRRKYEHDDLAHVFVMHKYTE